MTTRRDFALWSGAAFLLGPRIALGGEPGGQKKRGDGDKKAAKALAGIGLSATPLSSTPGRLVLQIHGTNTTEVGIGVGVDLAGVDVLRGGKASEGTVAWLNNQMPYSRRIMAPPFVDLPAGQPLLAATVTVEYPEALNGQVADVQVRMALFMDGARRTVTLAPVSVKLGEPLPAGEGEGKPRG
jgi:hypothetical protein